MHDETSCIPLKIEHSFLIIMLYLHDHDTIRVHLLENWVSIPFSSV